jgi:activating signal cointegrator 1
LKAITVIEPYASLIATGEKWVENRTWETFYRGPLAIHAGSGTHYLSLREILAEGLPVGAVIATCRLVARVSVERLIGSGLRISRQQAAVLPGIGIEPGAFLDHEHVAGPWRWVLADIRALDPVPCKGRLGLWGWTPPAPPAITATI